MRATPRHPRAMPHAAAGPLVETGGYFGGRYGHQTGIGVKRLRFAAVENCVALWYLVATYII